MPTPVIHNPKLLPKLLLASSSAYRAQLLRKLKLDFTQKSPNIDETPLVNEKAHDLVLRLSKTKALALCQDFNEHIIIASDQVAVDENKKIIGKPNSTENAIKQLMGLQGQAVEFLTSLTVMCRTGIDEASESLQHLQTTLPYASNPIRSEFITIDDKHWRALSVVEPYMVHFRDLNQQQIAKYVELENPIDCAGSFKSEGLGIALFNKIEGEDPNSLVGLPLIKLCQILELLGCDVLFANK